MMANILIFSLLLKQLPLVWKFCIKNIENLYSYLGTFLHFCLRFSFYQSVDVSESRINIILGLNFAGVWQIKIAMRLIGFDDHPVWQFTTSFQTNFGLLHIRWVYFFFFLILIDWSLILILLHAMVKAESKILFT